MNTKPLDWSVVTLRTFDTAEERDAGLDAEGAHMQIVREQQQALFDRFLARTPGARALNPIKMYKVGFPKRQIFDFEKVLYTEDFAAPKFSFAVHSSCEWEVL